MKTAGSAPYCLDVTAPFAENFFAAFVRVFGISGSKSGIFCMQKILPRNVIFSQVEKAAEIETLVFCAIMGQIEHVFTVLSRKNFCCSILKWRRQSKQCQVYFSSKSGKKFSLCPGAGLSKLEHEIISKKIQI